MCLLVGILIWGACDWGEENQVEAFPQQGHLITQDDGKPIIFTWPKIDGDFLDTKFRLYEVKKSNRNRSHEMFRAPLILESDVQGKTTFQVSIPKAKTSLSNNQVFAWEVIGTNSSEEEVPLKELSYFGVGPVDADIRDKLFEPCAKTCVTTRVIFPDCQREIIIPIVCPCSCPPCLSVHKVNGYITDGITESFSLASRSKTSATPCVTFADSLEIFGNFSITVPADEISTLDTSYFYTYLFENERRVSSYFIKEEYLVNLDTSNIHTSSGIAIDKSHYDSVCLDKSIALVANIDLKLKFPTPEKQNRYSIVVFLGTNYAHLPIPTLHDSQQRLTLSTQNNHGIPSACGNLDRNDLDYYTCLDSSSDDHISNHVVIGEIFPFCQSGN